MLNMKNYGHVGRIAAPVSPADALIRVTPGASFAVPSGDHYYLTIRDGQRREVVRVTRTAGEALAVDRGQDGTLALYWSVGACVEVEWNPQQLREFVANIAQSNIMSPGTYCLGCSTCITVNSAGQITSINGEEKC